MFATFKRTGLCRGTAILVSESPEGPFVEHSNGAVTPTDWECLDGTLYLSPDEIPYMVFCHEWVQVKDGEICLQQLSEDLSQAVGNPIVLFKASEAEWVRPINNDGDAFVTDGPFLYRCENGKLLMLWSSFGEYGYAEAIAESENGKIEGPWKQSNQLLFEKDGGHGMIFEDVHENKYVVLHAPNISYNERPVLYKIIEKDNWIFRANEQE